MPLAILFEAVELLIAHAMLRCYIVQSLGTPTYDLSEIKGALLSAPLIGGVVCGIHTERSKHLGRLRTEHHTGYLCILCHLHKPVINSVNGVKYVDLTKEIKPQKCTGDLGAVAFGNSKIATAQDPHTLEIIFCGNKLREYLLTVKSDIRKHFLDNVLFT